jgi:hypothetical protein
VTSFEIAAQAMRDKGLDPENDDADGFRAPGRAGAPRHAAQRKGREGRPRTRDAVEAANPPHKVLTLRCGESIPFLAN